MFCLPQKIVSKLVVGFLRQYDFFKKIPLTKNAYTKITLKRDTLTHPTKRSTTIKTKISG